MIKAFKERRWWAAALINFVFDPFLGMLYLGRGRTAFIYLFVECASLVPLMGYILQLSSNENAASWQIYFCTLPIRLVATIHARIIAQSRPKDVPLPRYSRWYFLIAIDLSFLVAALIIRTFFFQPFNLPSTSMSPTLNMGDYIFVSKRAFDRLGPQRGDIVVFHRVDGDYVKRIVGIPGDRVQMIDGKLVINGKVAPQHRVEEFVGSGFDKQHAARQYAETLPSGRSYNVLDLVKGGDEDNTSIFIVPPGHYFVLGDNRDNSYDSRMDMGPIARGDIIGKVVIKFADRQHKTMIWESVN